MWCNGSNDRAASHPEEACPYGKPLRSKGHGPSPNQALAKLVKPYGNQLIGYGTLRAITGVWAQTTDRVLGRAVGGFEHYLLKPCDPKEVIRLIEGYAADDPRQRLIRLGANARGLRYGTTS